MRPDVEAIRKEFYRGKGLQRGQEAGEKTDFRLTTRRIAAKQVDFAEPDSRQFHQIGVGGPCHTVYALDLDDELRRKGCTAI